MVHLKNSQCTYNGLIKSKSFPMLFKNGNRLLSI